MNNLCPKELGVLGEEIAENFLKKKNYQILEKNFRKKWGEIDIIAKIKKTIVFCEVKTIYRPAFQNQPFAPENQINWRKKRQLLKMAQIYLSSKKIPLDAPHQIDILAIEILAGKTKIRHYKNAIEDGY